MPAAAVIPAPIAYTYFVAVKKLVVGFLPGPGGSLFGATAAPARFVLCCRIPAGALDRVSVWRRQVYFEKIRVLQAGFYSPE